MRQSETPPPLSTHSIDRAPIPETITLYFTSSSSGSDTLPPLQDGGGGRGDEGQSSNDIETLKGSNHDEQLHSGEGVLSHDDEGSDHGSVTIKRDEPVCRRKMHLHHFNTLELLMLNQAPLSAMNSGLVDMLTPLKGLSISSCPHDPCLAWVSIRRINQARKLTRTLSERKAEHQSSISRNEKDRPERLTAHRRGSLFNELRSTGVEEQTCERRQQIYSRLKAVLGQTEDDIY